MLRNIMLGLLGLSLATQATALAPARQYTPEWSVGTSWALKTQFRKMADRDGRALGWSDPVTFVYTVKDRQENGGRTTFRIHAEPKTAGSGFETDLTMVAEGGKLSVASVTTRHRRHGAVASDAQEYASAMPVFTESSIIPYDAPVFPLVQAGNLDASSYLTAKRKFQRVERAGGLSFARTHSQLVKASGQASSYTDAGGAAVEFQVSVQAGQVFPVEMKEETTGQAVVQYWATAKPWAVYSENASSRAWLVE